MIGASSFFYHIYPLGFCGCPKRNDFCQAAGDGLKILADELPRFKDLGVNAILLGPLFESTAHGYDTLDYFYVDRRLGTNDDLKFFVEKCHELKIDVALDAVFNHSGRDFFAFKDLQKNGADSKFKDWYKDVRFGEKSPCGDNFSYANWAGCSDLVKFNLENPEVRKHLFSACKNWIEQFDIDGLRLDAADVLSFDFMKDLRKFTRALKNGFWLMGEVVHGDYNRWASEQMLDSVTNYQLYKGLWSSFNDSNFFEVAYSLNEHFGSNGKYRDKIFYNFLDNQDVNRIASTLKNPEQIFALYALLFCVLGIPSIYYGSEIGIRGERNQSGDFELRPALPPFSQIPEFARPKIDSEKLRLAIKKLAEVRANSSALQNGNYKQIFVSNTAFAFLRQNESQTALAIFNIKNETQKLQLEHIPQGNYFCAMSKENFLIGEKTQIEMGANSFKIFLKG